jgi:hypothetical protein
VTRPEDDRQRFLELIAAAEALGSELEPLVDAAAQPVHREGVAAALRALARTRERLLDGTFRSWPPGTGLGISRPFDELSRWPAEIEPLVDSFADALGAVETFWGAHEETFVGGS